MIADRVYGRGFLEGSNERMDLLYFTAAVPMVGFVHSAAGLNLRNSTGFEGYAEARFTKRAQPIDTTARAKCATMPSRSSKWWPLGLRWLA
jgi:hypothetical protein